MTAIRSAVPADNAGCAGLRRMGAATLVLLLAASGARAQALSGSDETTIANLLGAGVLGSAVSETALAHPAALLPLEAATWNFQMTSGPNQGNAETDTLQPSSPGSPSPWQYAAGQNTIYALAPAADGSIVSPSEQDLGQGVLTRYDPPRPFLLEGAQAGVPQTFTLAVNVYDLGDTSTVTHTGSLALTYTYVGRYQVSVPAGTYTAALVKLDYNGTVGPASVQDSEYRFYADGVGPVAVIDKQNVSAFLLYNSDTKTAKVLASAPQ